MNRKDKWLYVTGAGILLLLLLPWFLLGESAVITYHDQLDGEMIAYILQAKHLGKGDVLPEFMHGAAKTALTLPAPASVLLFLGGHYEAALFVMQLLGSLIGYTGMFLLVGEITKKPFPALAAGGLYGALPLLPVYGLSQYGLPLLVWCILQLKKGKRTGFCLGYALFFALDSSLALVGFAVLAVTFVWILAEMGAQWRKKERPGIRLPLLWLMLLAGYLSTNLPLIAQILGGDGKMLSHKAEYALRAENFFSAWVQGILYGGQHSQDYHLSFLPWGGLVLVLSLRKEFRTERVGQLRRVMLGIIGCNVFFAMLAAFWNSAAGVYLRAQIGVLGAFQVERFLWLSPCMWYLFLGVSMALGAEYWNISMQKKPGVGKYGNDIRKSAYKAGCFLCGGVLLVSLGITSWQIVKNSDFKCNVQKLLNPEYPAMSYEDYYAIGVYEQVKAFMAEYTGQEQEEYRVVSLGIDPAAALYHGFYCLDGYSNNYSLEYKHLFRKIIAPALQESAYLQDYFDNWGNRCYLFGSECPGYYTIEKNGFYFSHLELDTQALSDLGGEYLFSAAYIANAEELGLLQLCEEPFETEDSYYCIWVYGIK